jgi:AcrR family transcriptional regulator
VSKGQQTRQIILDRALDVASTDGLEQLTIGSLAQTVGMSKSGLFAHFRSKEQLQIQVIDEAAQRFVARVVRPAIREPRGEPRVRAMFRNWMQWNDALPGGCVIQSASMELDDRPGPVRDYLAKAVADRRTTMLRAAEIAVAEGHFCADLDLRLFVFQADAIALAYQSYRGLHRDEHAGALATQSFDALLAWARA